MFGAIDVPANATLEQVTHVHRRRSTRSSSRTPEFDHSFQLTLPDRRLRRHAGRSRGSERKRNIFADPGGAHRQARRASPASARRCSCRRRCPSAGLFPVEFVIASTASHEELVALRATSSCEAAKRAGSSRSRRSPTCGSIRRTAEIVLDRDKVASMGLRPCSRSAPTWRRCSAATSSTASTSTAAATRSSRRSSASGGSRPSSSTTSTSRARTASSSRSSAVATLRTGVEPRTLNRFQQLNAVKISGVAPRSLDGGLRVLEDAAREGPAAGLPHRLHRRVAPAAPGGRQVPARDGPRAAC